MFLRERSRLPFLEISRLEPHVAMEEDKPTTVRASCDSCIPSTVNPHQALQLYTCYIDCINPPLWEASECFTRHMLARMASVMRRVTTTVSQVACRGVVWCSISFIHVAFDRSCKQWEA